MQCSITVITPITSLAVSPTSETVYVGNTIQLTGTVNPSNTTESTLWTSSNTDVATVSDTGLVTAKSAGTATITFKNSSVGSWIVVLLQFMKKKKLYI